MAENRNFEVIIVGGSYAGLSAAMALGRSLRRVLIIDSGLPCNRQTPHSHNFITHDGDRPADIAEKAKTEVLQYETVGFLNGRVVKGEKTGSGFMVKTDSGEQFEGKKLIFATGIKDKMPAIKGFSECWGITVIHCPYCHGYEFRKAKTGILANGERGFHIASLVNNLTNELMIMTSGEASFTPDQRAKLARHHIPIIETEVAEIVHREGHVEKVIFKDGREESFQAVYAVVPFEQHCEVPVGLGCELTEHGYIKVDPFQKTTVEGVFACGDNSGMLRSVANAVYSGNLTGAMVNRELTEEGF